MLAIDLGGTQIRAAHVGPDLTVSARRSVATDAHEGVDAVVERLCTLAGAVRDDALAASLPAPVGIGISSPGPIDPWRGVVIAPPNLDGWSDVPLTELVERRLGLPTLLERDTNVAVMCEWKYGAAQGCDDVIYITVSTGIGGGIVIDGRPLIGKDATAGEVGHVTVELDGPLCGDGQRGHAEAIGSGTAIAREARAALAAGAGGPLRRLVDEASAEPDAALVARAADAGDPIALGILDRAWTAIGALCASLVNLLDPQMIVIGGSIAEHRPDLFEGVRREIDARAFPIPARRVRLALPRYSGDVSLIGSLPIVNQRIDDPAFRRVASRHLEEAT